MRNFILVLGFSLLAASASGQDVQLLVGQRVWVRVPNASGRLDGGVKGIVEGITDDSLEVLPAGGGPVVSFGRDPRTPLYVFTGRRSSAVIGAVVGASLGALTGFAAGLASSGDCATYDIFCVDQDPAVLAARAGAFGLLTGLLIGSLSHHDVWERVDSAPAVRPIITPRASGIGLGLSLSF